MIEGRWMPQTEEEAELLQDIHIVTRYAATEGVSKARIASLLAFMASAAAQQSDFEDGAQNAPQGQQSESDPQDMIDGPQCPDCGAPIDRLEGSMGDDEMVLKPCDHSIDADEHGELIREVSRQ